MALDRNVPLMPALYRPHPMGYLVHCWGNVPEHSIVLVTRQTVLCTTPFSFGMRKLEKSILWHTVCINRKRGVCSRRSVYARFSTLRLTQRAILHTLKSAIVVHGTLYAEARRHSPGLCIYALGLGYGCIFSLRRLRHDCFRKRTYRN